MSYDAKYPEKPPSREGLELEFAGMTSPLLYHGGVVGLSRGDVIRPGHSRDNRHPGCPHCAARAAGEQSIDPASGRPDRVYVTTGKAYARYYASLYGHGDLYEVEPVGAMEPSTEDPFPTYVVPAARVVNVVERGVLLRHSERRKLYRAHSKAEGIPRRQAEAEMREMIRAVRP